MTAPLPRDLLAFRGVAHDAASGRVYLALCRDLDDCSLYEGRLASGAPVQLTPTALPADYSHAWPRFAPGGGRLAAVRWRRDIDVTRPQEIVNEVVLLGAEVAAYRANAFIALAQPLATGLALFESTRFGVDPQCVVNCRRHGERWRLVVTGPAAAPLGSDEFEFPADIFPRGGERFLATAAVRSGGTGFTPIGFAPRGDGGLVRVEGVAGLQRLAAASDGEAYPGARHAAVLEQRPQASALSMVAAAGAPKSTRANTAIDPSGAAIVVENTDVDTTGRVVLHEFRWRPSVDGGWEPVARHVADVAGWPVK
jgi:hypothetical protein